MRQILSIFAALAFMNASCTKKSESSSDGKKEVNLAIWGNYLAKETVDKFFQQTGIKINITNYSSNEELLAKVQSGASGFDVAVPSDYMVNIMTKGGLLVPLQMDKVPNRSHIDQKWLAQSFDPQNTFSLPYAWATAGIAVNRDLYKGPLKSWKDVFENKELSGKLSLLDDVREVTGAALKMHGFSVNTTKKPELDEAKKTLMEVKARVKMFSSDTIDNLGNKIVAVAHAYSTDALQAQAKTNGKIQYIIPEDGGTRSIDNLVIIKGAKNLEAAHALINFILSPENNVLFVKTIMAGPVLKETRALLPPELQKSSGLFPDDKVMSRLEKIEDVGDSTKLYDELWTQFKTQ